jgi:hypothetical protein
MMIKVAFHAQLSDFGASGRQGWYSIGLEGDSKIFARDVLEINPASVSDSKASPRQDITQHLEKSYPSDFSETFA